MVGCFLFGLPPVLHRFRNIHQQTNERNHCVGKQSKLRFSAEWPRSHDESACNDISISDDL